MQDYRDEVQSRYDDYLMKTEKRGISYGEVVHIQGLNRKGLDGMSAELDDFERKSSATKATSKAVLREVGSRR